MATEKDKWAIKNAVANGQTPNLTNTLEAQKSRMKSNLAEGRYDGEAGKTALKADLAAGLIPATDPTKNAQINQIQKQYATPAIDTSYQALTKSYQDLMDTQMANYVAPRVQTNTEVEVPETPVAPVDNGSGGGGGGTVGYSDPSLDAYMEAIRQQNELRKQEAQRAYDAAIARLNEAYGRSSDGINRTADDALRQAYINSQLSRKGLTEDLANRGIVGGATESILAKLANSYGNNRQNIEDSRANSLNELLAAYNANVASAGNNFANGISDIDTDYFNQYSNALMNQYNNDAKLRNALASTTRSTSSDDDFEKKQAEFRKNIVSTLKSYKGDDENAIAYLANNGIPESEWNTYFLDAGLGAYRTPEQRTSDSLSALPMADMNSIIENLGYARGNRATEDQVARLMQRYQDEYGFDDNVARYLLAQAGF